MQLFRSSLIAALGLVTFTLAAQTPKAAPAHKTTTVSASDQAALTPPMGWNSWNRYHDKFDDATVRGMADAMVSSTPCFSIQSARHFSI